MAVGGIEDGESSRHTLEIDETVDKVTEMTMSNWRFTIRKITDKVDVSNGSWHDIFSIVLGMNRMSAKFVPQLLNFHQKQH